MQECGFTRRERTIIDLIRDDGLAGYQISERINYSDSTIDRDVRRIKNKIIAFESARNLPPS